MNKFISHAVMFTTSSALLALACSLVGPSIDLDPIVPGRPGEFPHAVHIGDEVGLSCLDCHVTADTEAAASMPTLAQCQLCHFGGDLGSDIELDGDFDIEAELGFDSLEAEADSDAIQEEIDPLAELEALLEEDEMQEEEPLDSEVTLQEEEDADGFDITELLQEPPELDPILAQFIREGDDLPTWSAVTKPGIDTTFSHARHYAAGVECNQCHLNIENSMSIERDLAVPMAACVSCHENRAIVDGGCNGCHPGIDSSWKPPTHVPNWESFHGAASKVKSYSPNQDCSLCHGPDNPQQSCQTCHASTPPKDHTPFFKNFSHGNLALFDRGRCLACHQEDTCMACHQATKPRSHRAGFGESANRHCLGCHLGRGQAKDCRVCHTEGAPSHGLAPTPPPSVPAHATATACMTCHASIKPPKHPFTGDGAYCRRCHK